MAFPIIPVLSLMAIAGGVTALAWYAEQSKEDQNKADQLAMRWFGRKFKQLAEYQQNQIRDNIG